MLLNNFCRPRQSILDTFNVPKTKLVFTDPEDTNPPPVFIGSLNLHNGDEFYLTSPDGDYLVIDQSPAPSDFYYRVFVVIKYADGETENRTISGGGQQLIHTNKDIIEIDVTRDENFMSSVPGYLAFEPLTIGIFDAINTVLPEDAELTMPAGADLDYLTNHAGQKAVCNLVHMMTIQNGYDDADNERIKHIDYADRVKLAQSIVRRFYDSWVKIYNAMETEYKPLENYSMFEKTEPNLTDTFGVSDDYEKKNERKTASKVTTEQEDVTTDGDVYGFNSSSAVPATKNTANGTVTVSGLADDNVNTDIETQTGSRVEKHTGDSKVTRSGNIGTLTSQAMLQSEIDLRIKNHMEDIIFSDVDQILTTAGYAPVLSNKIHII